MNRALDTIRYNVSGPSLDTMDTNLTSLDLGFIMQKLARLTDRTPRRRSEIEFLPQRAARAVGWGRYAS